MTDKDLKRMNRRELLQMLLYLREENEKLSRQLDEANKKLRDRSILIDKAGSIAEAAVRLNGVFEAAEKAASDYLENVRELESRQDRICENVLFSAREKAENIVAEAEAYSKKTRADADMYWKTIREKGSSLMKKQDG